MSPTERRPQADQPNAHKPLTHRGAPFQRQRAEDDSAQHRPHAAQRTRSDLGSPTGPSPGDPSAASSGRRRGHELEDERAVGNCHHADANAEFRHSEGQGRQHEVEHDRLHGKPRHEDDSPQHRDAHATQGGTRHPRSRC